MSDNTKPNPMDPLLEKQLAPSFMFAMRRLRNSPFKITYLGQSLEIIMMYQDMLQIEKDKR